MLRALNHSPLGFCRTLITHRVLFNSLARSPKMSSQPNKKQKIVTHAGMEATDFNSITEELKQYDEQRELIIKRSRDIQKASKQAIFSLHRSDDHEATQRLAAAEKAMTELLPLVIQQATLRQGSFSNSLEEYAEAVVFRHFLLTGKLPTRHQVGEHINAEEYLGGVLDFTGELNRYAIAKATVRDKQTVQTCRDIVDGLFGQFLQLDLRNGSLRKKYDGLKYTLKKLENTLYELSLTENGLPTTATEEMPDVPGPGGDNADDA